jgi:T5SS/PEP-CTERM-associated repeat protein
MKDGNHHLGFEGRRMGRTRGWFLGVVLAAVVCGGASSGWAEDYVTNTVNGVPVVVPGDMIVGTNGSFNALIVTNAGMVIVPVGAGIIGSNAVANSNMGLVSGVGSLWSNSGMMVVGNMGSTNQLTINGGGVVMSDGTGVIGKEAGANKNMVFVTDPGSIWSNAAGVLVGAGGSGNAMVLTNGGQAVSSGFLSLGGNVGADSNFVVVTGAGSAWVGAGDALIGATGSFNQLTVIGGGSVTANNASVGFDSNANNNAVLVTGAGSVWSNAGNVAIGYAGSGNSLMITNGAMVFSANGYVGQATNTSAGNTVSITDAGSIWSNSGSLYVGQYGGGNRLTIRNGGQVVNGDGYIGWDGQATNNTVLVADAGSAWINNNDLYVGWFGSNGWLIVTNGAKVMDQTGNIGMLGSNNTVLVSGANSLWGNVGALYVGRTGSNNTLVINTGALVTNGSGWIGLNTNAFNNAVLVTGAGSVWSNYYHLGVGVSGSGNSLVVSNGAQVINVYGEGNIGYYAGASNNTVVVTGTNSLWRNIGNRIVFVGYGGSANSLTISDGGQVVNGAGYVGWDTNANLNSALVTGAGSLWSNGGEFAVGYAGSGNNLTISNGGQMISGASYVGHAAGAMSNAAVVTGGGSVWSVGGDLQVGVTGSFNRLTIRDGGVIVNNSGFVGFDTNAGNNAVLVSGVGAVWTNNGDLTIGHFGFGNGMTVSNAGLVVNNNGLIGFHASASNNAVLVSGPGTIWSNINALAVGVSGIGNGLTINNSGVIYNTTGFIGLNGSSTGNWASVSGAGATWNNSGDLYVGATGSFNRLAISDGGRVNNVNGHVGFDAGASNNSVVVSGAGAFWNNSGNLFIDDSGSGNGLIVSNGGTVANVNGHIGFGAAATNNWALVTGAGSLWTNSGDLFVGVAGSSNRLIVSDGGLVVNTHAHIGVETNAFGNSVTVTGTGSVWRSGGKLYVGSSGSSNTMMVTIGGQAISGDSVIGLAATASSNVVEVSGAGATWTAAGLSVGQTGSFNRLVVADGGHVASGAAMIGMMGSANSALVGGTGSVWNLGGNDLVVGSAGIGNALVVTNGGQVLGRSGYIGWDGAATNNSALVSGAGAQWNNNDSLYVGFTGSFNQLTVNDNGTVAATNIVLGYSMAATGSVITVAGGNLYATNAAGSGALDVHNGTLVFNGGNVIADHFYLTNNVVSATNSVLNFNSGTLTTRADSRIVTPLGDAAIIGGTAGQAAAWNMLGGGTVIRDAAGGAGLLILGNVLGATGAVMVSGGTLDLNNGVVRVGENSAGNSMVITNGGRVFSSRGIIGHLAGATDNTVLVTGAGSAWNITNDLSVGRFGSGNILTVSGGGTVTATNIIIGFDAASANNRIVMLAGGNLNATNSASGGALDVRNGSLAFNGGQVAANYFYATNNTAGASKSVFNFNAGTLNTLNGSQIVVPTGSNLIIGASVGGTAAWNILGGTNLVGEVAGNTSTTIVGGVAGALGVVTVSGAGTVWSNTTDLSVGDASKFNVMTITNGAKVMSVNGFIGNAAGADSNLVVVAGTNSLWLTSGNLIVGNAGISNMLVVTSGATVDVRGTFRVGPNAQFLNAGTLLSAATEIGPGGSLTITTGGALGTGAVANSGTLIFNPAGMLTVSNAISGPGNMIENGPGTLVLISSNSYTGGTLIAGGTVSLKNTYALGFGPVTLTGGLLKADPLLMSFVSYSQSGGTLQLAVGGKTAPGVDYDQVNVTGAATISGGTLKIVPWGAYQPKRGDAVPLLVAAGGLTGTYPSFDSTAFYAGPTPASTLLQPNLSYSPTMMTLQWLQLPFLPYATTPNQQAVARNLDSTATDPRTKAAMDYIDYLPGGTAQVASALDLISPQQLIPMFTMGFAGAEVQGYNLLARMRDIRAGSSGFSSSGLSFYDPTGTVDGRMGFYDPVGASGPGPLTHLASSEAGESTRVFKNKPLFLPLKDNPWGVFVSGAGQFVGVQGDRNANGYHVASGGFTVGADYRLMDGTMYPFDQLVIGAALGYANSSSDIGGSGRINVNGGQANVYSAWFKEGFHVEGMLGGGFDVYDTRRDALGGSATANVNGYHLQGMLGTGYDWQSGPWTFGPQVSAQYTRVMLDSFTESGSLLPLRFDSQNADSLHSRLGAHLSYRALLGKIMLTPEVRAGWRHEFMSPDITLNSQFANGAGGVFGVRGPALGKDSAVLGAGLSAQWTDEVTTFINYDTELGRANYQLHYVNAGVRINL